MAKYIVALGVFLFVLLGGTGLFISKTDSEARMECLHDADCRNRLEVMINEIYQKAGYSESTSQ